MQVEVDVKHMQTNFGRRGLFSFRDFASFLVAFKTAKFSLRTMGYSPWSSKNLINQNRLRKFMQVGIDVTCMYTELVGVVSPVSEIPLLSKKAKFPFRTMGYI